MRPSLLMSLLICALAATSAQAASGGWVGSWAASPAPPVVLATTGAMAMPANPSFDNQTLVQTVRLSAGGRRLRIRFSNEYGDAPLEIGAARAALVAADGTVVAGSERAVTFSGAPAATLPPHAPLVSDPVELAAAPLADVRISLYLPGRTGPCTCHILGGQLAEVSPPGDYTQQSFTPAATMLDRAFVTEVDVEAPRARPVVVAFGDSITDGYRSTPGANRRWPDRLAERLGAARKDAAVVNAGVGGNRILADGFFPSAGENALARFDRDVLSVPGATHLIVLEGVNDIGDAAADPPSAQALIAGYEQMIARAHAHGLKAIGATILPYEGAFYYRPQGEAVRQAVNQWIRASGAFDGVIDFDALMRDPAHPARLRPELQSGDWLHPNDAGYRAMGDAVPLGLFR
jgi:lysophospholipase L1-like esterase